MRRIAEAVAGVRHRRHCAWPVAGRLPELGLVHQALAAVGHQVRLGLAPLVQCCRPLSGPGQVEELHALEDHGAVDDPRHDRPHLAGAHRQHHFVQPGQPGRLVAHCQQRLAVPERRERCQVSVTEARRDLAGLHGELPRASSVVGVERAEQGRDEQIAACWAVEVLTEHGLATA